MKEEPMRAAPANPVVLGLLAGCFGALAAVCGKLGGLAGGLPGYWVIAGRVVAYAALFGVRTVAAAPAQLLEKPGRVTICLSIHAVQRCHDDLLRPQLAQHAFAAGHAPQQHQQHPHHGESADITNTIITVGLLLPEDRYRFCVK